MSSEALEKRYRMILRAYPAEYRRERADELIDTLIGDEPSTHRWPTLRQAASLVRGALRVHGGSTAPRPLAVLLWQGIHLGAMAVLALGALIGLDDLAETLTFGGLSDPLTVLRNQGIHEVMVVAALVTLAAGRTRAAAVLTVAAAVVPNFFSTYLLQRNAAVVGTRGGRTVDRGGPLASGGCAARAARQRCRGHRRHPRPAHDPA